MAKSFTVSFNILGNLDPSLQAALTAAAQKMKSLGDAAKSLNARAIQSAGKLKELQAQLKAIEKYRALEAKIDEGHRQRKDLKTQRGTLSTNLQAEQRRMNQMRSSLDALKKEYADNKSLKGTSSDWGRSMRDQIRAAKEELRGQEQIVRGIRREYENSDSKIGRLGETLRQQHAQLRELGTGLNVSNIAAQESSLRAQIEQTTAALNQEIAALQRRAQIQSNFNEASQNLSNAYSNFQNSIQTAQQIMTPFKDAADNATSFEYAMSKVKALTQMKNIRSGDMERVRVEMEALTKQAEQLGATTEFKSQQIAEAMGFYGMAGWDAKQIQAAMSQTVDLATITGKGNIPRIADILSDDMTALGLKAGEGMKLAGGKIVDSTSYFTDAFAYAITQANLNEEQLHEALKYNAPTSHAAELSIGETFAMNMISANAGIKSSQAGTAFRAGWTRFLAPPKQAQKALESMGATASDAQREIMEAGAALESIGVKQDAGLFEKITAAYQHYQSLDKGGKAGFLTSLVGRNALSAWQAIFDKGKIEEIAEIARQIDTGEIEGWATDTANVMRDNTKTSMDLLASSLDALQRNVGQALIPALRSAAEAFAPIVTAASEWIAKNPEIVQGAALIATALAAATVAVAGFSLAMAGVRFVQAGWATAGLVFGDIAAKAAIASTSIKAFFASMWAGSISSTLAAGISSIGTALTAAGRAAMAFAFSPVGAALIALALAGLYCYQNWDRVSSTFSSLASTLSGIIAPAVDAAKQSLETLGQALNINFDGGAFAALKGVIGDLTSAVGGTLVGAFITAAGVIGSVLAAIVTGIAGLVKTIADLGTGLTEAFNQLSEGNFSAAFDTLANTGKQAAVNFKDAWLDSFSAFKQGIVGTSQALNEFINYQPPSATSGFISAGANQLNQPQTQPLDTSQAQDALNQIPAAVTPATESLIQIGMASANVSMETQNQVAALQTHSSSLMANGAALDGNVGSLYAFGAAADGACGGTSALGAAADGASGSVSGLGAAASAACAQLAAAGASAAANVAGALSAGLANIKANYSGGIYRRGAFLTTFAEKSPEAAIPLDGSQRAIDLWTKAGQILGTLPKTQSLSYDEAPKDFFGNLTDIEIPEENRIDADDTISVSNAKQAKQRELYESQKSAREANLAKAIQAFDYLPDTPENRQAKANLLRDVELYRKNQPAQRPLYSRRRPTATTERRQRTFQSVPPEALITSPTFNPQIQSPQVPIFDEFRDKIFNPIPTVENQSSPTFQITMNFTINGNTDEQTVRNGVEQALPAIDDWVQKYADFQHEKARSSFA